MEQHKNVQSRSGLPPAKERLAALGNGKLAVLTRNIGWNCLNADVIRRMKALHASGRRGHMLYRRPDRRMGEPALLSLPSLIPYEPHRKASDEAQSVVLN